MSAVTEALPLPEVYYQASDSCYWRKDGSGVWISVNSDMAKKFVVECGRSKTPENSGENSEADRCLLDIQTRQNVVYAGPISGHQAGPLNVNDSLILVTKSPKPVQPVAGEWPVLQELLHNMFGDEQLPYFYGWMKSAMDSFLNQRLSQAQALAIAGPPNAGKTLLVSLMKRMFGGSTANPYPFMTGATTFNSELFKSELLVVDDQAESIDMRARRKFAASIKEFTVTQDLQCHGKNREALSLAPIWRIVILLNDDPERLQVLPPFDQDVADKIMLLKATRMPMPMPTDSPEAKALFMSTLKGELPAFVHFLSQYQVSAEDVESRYGIKTYHHPELLQSLDEASPETRLMELVDLVLFPKRTGWEPICLNGEPPQPAPFVGSASELTSKLLDERSYEYQVRTLLKHNNSCGTFLSRLEDGPKSRVTSRYVRGNRIYTILPPDQGGVVDHFSKSIDGKKNKESAGSINPVPLTRKTAPPLHPGRQFLPPTPPPRQEADTRALAV